MRATTRLVLLVAAAAALLALVPAGAAAKTKWLCRPGLKNNPCVGNLNASVLKPDGSFTVERRKNARNAPIDCFYIYPTVSDQQTINANLRIDPEIRSIAVYQAARFSQVCRVWAPVYRQLTLKGIFDRNSITPAASAKAYNSALAGWRDYIRNHNHGRGFVLIGHSQGTFVLRQLIAQEIDKRPAIRRRLVSALLLGGNVTVRKGRGVGGDFKNIPACRRAKQTGCVVAYSSFGDTPPPNALFGRVSGSGASKLRVLCTNPAALGGGSGTLRPYTPTAFFPGTIGLGVRIFTGPLPQVPTPWLVPPGRYRARCSGAAGANVLRIDSLGGAHRPTPSPDPTWGFHLGDVNLAIGNLTGLVAAQSAAYRRHGVAHSF
ncbi:MAG TPA: DUF3089 domain-containing protein [Thermoleophilaceae bacterium]